MKKVLAITMLSALALVSCTTAADGRSCSWCGYWKHF